MNHTIIILLLFLILFLIPFIFKAKLSQITIQKKIKEKFQQLNVNHKHEDILFKQFKNNNLESTTTTKNIDVKQRIQNFKKHNNLKHLYSLMSRNNKIKNHVLLIKNEANSDKNINN